MKFRIEMLFYLTGLFLLLFFNIGCLEKTPNRKKQSETPISKDINSYLEFQGLLISQKKIDDSTYEIKAKANDTANVITFLSGIPIDVKSLNKNDSSTLILKYLIDVDSNTNKPIFRVKVIDIFSVIRKEN